MSMDDDTLRTQPSEKLLDFFVNADSDTAPHTWVESLHSLLAAFFSADVVGGMWKKQIAFRADKCWWLCADG